MNDPIHPTEQASRLKLHPILWLVGLGILCAPAVAMLMTSEVDWGVGDFLVFGAILTTVLGVIEVAISRSVSRVVKALLVGVSLVVFVLIWAELGVGIID